MFHSTHPLHCVTLHRTRIAEASSTFILKLLLSVMTHILFFRLRFVRFALRLCFYLSFNQFAATPPRVGIQAVLLRTRLS